MLKDKMITLPKKGRLIVVSDLHGNFNDYKSYLNLWNSSKKDNHIVFMGDLIHSPYPNDQSVEILDDAIIQNKKSNFHVLLGNHEWAHITKSNLYKMKKNQRTEFEELVKSKKGFLTPALEEYVDFFKSMPLFMKTENGLFLSHAGPSNNMQTREDFNKIFGDDYNNDLLYAFLWYRFERNYSQEDVSRFLSIVESNCMIIGHTPVDSYKIFGKQVILSSSFCTDKKVYFDIDLSKKIEDVSDLMKYLKYL